MSKSAQNFLSRQAALVGATAAIDDPLAFQHLGSKRSINLQKRRAERKALNASIKNPLIDTEEAASMIGASPKTLAFWRCVNKGPAYCKIGGRVLYRQSDIEAYIASTRIDPSAAA